jgi:ATP-dependent Clp protease ATP-binding subunit ClpA
LFDEIEKAHADVFNLFLQILDEGRLTDGHGKTVDFKNTLIIMTSNIAGKMIEDTGMQLAHLEKEGPVDWERGYDTIQEAVRQELRSHFRPEFLNRNLTRDQIKDIVDIQMDDLRKRLVERNITLTLTEEAKALLAEKGYDPVFGARPLKRVVQKYIQDPLSRKILEENFGDGDHIQVELSGDVLTFSRKDNRKPDEAI